MMDDERSMEFQEVVVMVCIQFHRMLAVDLAILNTSGHGTATVRIFILSQRSTLIRYPEVTVTTNVLMQE